MLLKQILPVLPIFWATLATAQDRYGVQATDNTDGDKPGTQIHGHVWTNAMDHANATVSLETFGYDVSKEFPGNRSEGWNLTLRIAGDMRLDSRHFTGASLDYTPPARLRNLSRDDSWGSYLDIRSIDFDVDQDLNEDCSGVLSKECLDDLRSNAEPGRGETSLPESCEDELGGDGNPSRIRLGPGAANMTDEFGVVAHKPGKMKFYDDLVSKVHVISMAYIEWDDNVAVEDGERLESILVCMRPEQFSSGSRDMEEVEAGVARLRAGRIFAMVVGTMAVAMVVG